MVDFSGRLRIPEEARPISKRVNAKSFSPMVMAMKSRIKTLKAVSRNNIRGLQTFSTGVGMSAKSASKFIVGSSVARASLKVAAKSVNPLLHIGVFAATLMEMFSKEPDGKSPQDERTKKRAESQAYEKEFKEGYDDGYKAYSEDRKTKYRITGTKSKKGTRSYLGSSDQPWGEGKGHRDRG